MDTSLWKDRDLVMSIKDQPSQGVEKSKSPLIVTEILLKTQHLRKCNIANRVRTPGDFYSYCR